MEYNTANNITPVTIDRSTDDILIITEVASRKKEKAKAPDTLNMSNIEKLVLIDKMTAKMHELAADLEFEEAARMRDMIKEVRKSIKTNDRG